MKAMPWRSELAGWPDYWRERWGQLANDLEADGVPWHRAEDAAFGQIDMERFAAGGTVPPAIAAEETASAASRQAVMDWGLL